MKKALMATALAALVVGLIGAATVAADGGRKDHKARLSGFQEVPPISTTGSGWLKLRVNSSPDSISYELRYDNLTGVTAAHIHFGQQHVNGGIIAFLCGGGGTNPSCVAGTTITGTILPANILAVTPPDQGIAAGEFTEAVRAIRNGSTYVNVHTSLFPNGELRGQIRHGWGKSGDHDD